MSKTLQNGSFVDPLNAPVANGSLELRLSQSAKSLTAGQVVPTLVTIALDASGDVTGSPSIWANDELTPAGTFYWVSVFTSAGARVYGPEKWVLSGGSPINLDNMTPTVADPLWADPVLKNPTADQTITGAFALLPDISGRDLGKTAQRWDLFSQALDVAGDSKLAGVVAVGGVSPDATTPLFVDKTYTNPAIETAGIRVNMRRTQTTATGQNQAVIGGNFAAIMVPGGSLPITDQVIAARGELYLGNPTVAAVFPQVFGVISTWGSVPLYGIAAVFGANNTVTNWRGFYIGAPPSGGGVITTGYGLEIESISVPTTKGAIKLGGQGDAGRIRWTNSEVTESSGGVFNQKVHANATVGCPIQVLHADGADFSLTGTTTETTLWSYQLPANTMRANDGLRFRVAGDVSGTLGTKTFRFKIASTTLATISLTAGETDDWAFEIHAMGRNLTNAQVYIIRAYQGNAAESGVDLLVFSSADMTTAITFSVTGQLGNAGDTVIKRYAMVEYLPKP